MASFSPPCSAPHGFDITCFGQMLGGFHQVILGDLKCCGDVFNRMQPLWGSFAKYDQDAQGIIGLQGQLHDKQVFQIPLIDKPNITGI